MHHSFRQRLSLSSASILAALALGASAGRAATTGNVSVGDMLAQTVYLPIRNPEGAEAAAQALQTPGATYHKFLSVQQFVSRYAPSDAQIAQVEAALVQLGYTIDYVFPNHLAIEVLSSAGSAEAATGVKLHHVALNGRSGIVPDRAPTLPASLRGLVRGIGGLNTFTHPHSQRAVAAIGHGTTRAAAGSAALVGGTPGNYLPADFERFYDVGPIHALGVNGRGSTIGIVTLANFKPSDAYLFWRQIGLDVSQTRITTVDVDGGTTIAPSDALGEGETDLDVEESGAIAPGARERVYVSPNNTNANFIDAFEAAASDNIADTVSSSWGQPELNFFTDIAAPASSQTFLLDAFHDAFLEMALQGQSVFIAAGDSGSFDTVRDCPAYGTPSAKTAVCNAPYAVDHPSSDPLVTAAGGTTLPFSATLNDGVLLSVAQQQAWGWDYISSEAAAQGHGTDLPVSAVFSVGDGGGVSSYFGKPYYQDGVAGITLTRPGQTLTQDNGAGPVLQYVLPANFAGRNTPDLSANADPESGYQFIEEGAVTNFEGGTSFVAPQLNGVNALFVQGLGGRTGQLNPILYALGPLISTDITAGDNWGYHAAAGYENAVGNGALDATRLAIGLAAARLIR